MHILFRVYMFGGVQDQEKEDEEEDDDSDDEGSGNFFNELYSVQLDGERATWHLVTLTGTTVYSVQLDGERATWHLVALTATK